MFPTFLSSSSGKLYLQYAIPSYILYTTVRTGCKTIRIRTYYTHMFAKKAQTTRNFIVLSLSLMLLFLPDPRCLRLGWRHVSHLYEMSPREDQTAKEKEEKRMRTKRKKNNYCARGKTVFVLLAPNNQCNSILFSMNNLLVSRSQIVDLTNML